jgi:hypothetical protein
VSAIRYLLDENVDPTLFHPPRPCRQGRGKLYFWMNAKQRRRSTMSVQLESLYQQIQSLSLCERMELISRVFADLKADLELQEEFAQWDRLSDEALEQFEESL